MRKILLASAFGSVFVLSGCGGSDDVAQIIADLEVTVSGQTTDLLNNSLQGVTIEGVYNAPGASLNPTTTNDTNGNFSIKVFKSSAVYLRASKGNYTTINSGKKTFNADESNFDIDMQTLNEAQDAINLAFSTMPPNFADKAWLIVDVISAANGTDLSGKTIVAASNTAEAYLDCNGMAGATVTVAGCTNRPTGMYMAYFDAGSETTITVDTETQTAVLRKGEVTILEFKQ